MSADDIPTAQSADGKVTVTFAFTREHWREAERAIKESGLDPGDFIRDAIWLADLAHNATPETVIPIDAYGARLLSQLRRWSNTAPIEPTGEA